MRKFKLFFLMLLIVLASVVPTGSLLATQPTLTDIAGHWAEAQIKQAVGKGYVSGYPDGTFQPNKDVSRAEFMTMLASALKLPHESDGSPWYQPYVTALIAAGVHDTSNFNSSYNAPLTRLEMVRLAVRAALDAEALPPVLEDAPDNMYMVAATRAGIVHGLAKGELAPEGTSTRAQAVAIIERILALLSGQTLPVDARAISYAEMAYQRTNMTAIFGLQPKPLPMKLELGLPYEVTVKEILVVDYTDPNGAYREWFPEIRSISDTNELYIIAYKLFFENKTPSNGTMMYEFDQGATVSYPFFTAYVPYELQKPEMITGVLPPHSLKEPFTAEHWYVVGIEKERGDVRLERQQFVLTLQKGYEYFSFSYPQISVLTAANSN